MFVDLDGLGKVVVGMLVVQLLFGSRLAPPVGVRVLRDVVECDGIRLARTIML